MKALWRLTKILYYIPIRFMIGSIAILLTVLYPFTYVLFGTNIYKTWGLKILEIEYKINDIINKNAKCDNK